MNAAYLDIKEIYGILRNKKIYSEYFKSLKPERALDLNHPMLFFLFVLMRAVRDLRDDVLSYYIFMQSVAI